MKAAPGQLAAQHLLARIYVRTEQPDKAMAVLVHSNWRRADGRYADDQNAAAEIAMWAIRQFQSSPTPP